MTADETKLKIALEALLDLHNLPCEDGYIYYASHIVSEALRDIQREHYFGGPSPVTQALIAGVRGF